jgi:hypothetical protein
MELSVTVAMEIRIPEEPRRVPVFLRNRMVVGFVKSVRHTYVLDNQTHTEVVVEVRDDVVQSVVRTHAETKRPVLHIFFPWDIEDFEMAYRA